MHLKLSSVTWQPFSLSLNVFNRFHKYPENVRYVVSALSSWMNLKSAKLWLFCLGPRVNSPDDDVIKWKHLPRNWPFVRGIHRSWVNSLHKGQWRGALMFSLICVWIDNWINNHEAGDLRCYRTHYDVIVIFWYYPQSQPPCNNSSKITHTYPTHLWMMLGLPVDG